MNCESCGQERPIAARGLCRTCYSRWQRGGTTAYIRPLRDRTCTVEGCTNRAHGQGLCNKHLLRLRRTGTTAEGRGYEHQEKDPDELLTTHDLYPIWAEFRRKNNPRPVFGAWRESLLVFAAAVGERPGRRFRIFPRDRNGILGPDNFEWRESLIERHPEETAIEYNKRHQLARRELNGSGMWNSDLQKRYGISLADLRRMREEQKDLCAISGLPETELRDDIPKALAIDHNHATGKVRQLILNRLNKAIGFFEEDPLLMAKAMLYLHKHSDDKAAIHKAVRFLLDSLNAQPDILTPANPEA